MGRFWMNSDVFADSFIIRVLLGRPPDNRARRKYAKDLSQQGRILSAALALAVSALTSHAANLHLAGPGASWENVIILTNSVTCDAILAGNEHTLLAASEANSELAMLPDWGAWPDLPDARLDVWIEVVADGSNVVSVLLGNLEAPALSLSCAEDWSIQPAGTARFEPPSPTAFGISTQSIHLVVYPGSRLGHGVSFAETRHNMDSWIVRPDLTLTAFGWLQPEQAVPNWSQVGVSLAGTEAALRSLRLHWAPDATIMILK